MPKRENLTRYTIEFLIKFCTKKTILWISLNFFEVGQNFCWTTVLRFALLPYYRRSFSFLPVDFVSAISKAPSISYFQLSRCSLWLHFGGESFSVQRSIGSRGFLLNIRQYGECPAYITLLRWFFQDDLYFSGKVRNTKRIVLFILSVRSFVWVLYEVVRSFCIPSRFARFPGRAIFWIVCRTSR